MGRSGTVVQRWHLLLDRSASLAVHPEQSEWTGQAWDATSRLTSASETQAVTVTGGGVTVGFRYTSARLSASSGDGNRLAQIGNGTLTTHTLDIGLALPEVLARQGSGWSELYVHQPNAVATKEGTGWSSSAADGLGSIRQQLDASGQVDAVNSYRPFGLPLEGNGGDPYGFTGEWWDGSENRGLLFLRARYIGAASTSRRQPAPPDQGGISTAVGLLRRWNRPGLQLSRGSKHIPGRGARQVGALTW